MTEEELVRDMLAKIFDSEEFKQQYNENLARWTEEDDAD